MVSKFLLAGYLIVAGAMLLVGTNIPPFVPGLLAVGAGVMTLVDHFRK